MSFAKIKSAGDGRRRTGQGSNNSDREKLKYLKKCPSVTLSTKIPRQIGLGLKLGLQANLFKNDTHTGWHRMFTPWRCVNVKIGSKL
jgi:hypothetical protein